MRNHARDIRDIPLPASLRRRHKSSHCLVEWCDAYLGRWFPAWTDDQRRAADAAHRVLMNGGRNCVELDRGTGKTTLAIAALLKGALEARYQFLLYLGRDPFSAESAMETIRRELLTNDLLLADYPEAVVPIRLLDGVAPRAAGQTYRGSSTLIEWRRLAVVLPTIPRSAASGVVLMAQSITSGLVGLCTNGKRPDFVILDDVRGDARSVAETAKRNRVVERDVPALGSPDTTPAILEFVSRDTKGRGQ